MKRALVTGGNRGIGLAIARGLADRGLEVVIGARDHQAGFDAAKQIGAMAVELDVARPESIAQAVYDSGPVDVLVNNGGILGSGRIIDDPQDL